MSNVAPFNETRPFNVEHAKAGAPYSTRKGQQVRILAYDMKVSDKYSLAALIRNGDMEYFSRYNDKGANVSGYEPLVMTPLAYIEDKPVFVGDELEWSTGKYDGYAPFEVTADWTTKSGLVYRWPRKAVMFKGREITMDSQLWHSENEPQNPNCYWRFITLRDVVPNESAFKMKFIDDLETYQMHYEWEKPFIDFEGRQLTKHSKLWHNPNAISLPRGEWKLINVSDYYPNIRGKSYFEALMINPEIHKFYSWEKPQPPKVKKQVWQAMYKSTTGYGKQLGFSHFASKQECEENCRDKDGFVEAMLTDEYEG